MRAASVNFGEDKVETLRLHRYKGALKAAIGSAEIYRANKKQVNLLSERSLKDPPLSITN